MQEHVTDYQGVAHGFLPDLVIPARPPLEPSIAKALRDACGEIRPLLQRTQAFRQRAVELLGLLEQQPVGAEGVPDPAAKPELVVRRFPQGAAARWARERRDDPEPRVVGNRVFERHEVGLALDLLGCRGTWFPRL